MPEKAAICHPVLSIKETIWSNHIVSLLKNKFLIFYFASSCPRHKLNDLSLAVGHELVDWGQIGRLVGPSGR